MGTTNNWSMRPAKDFIQPGGQLFWLQFEFVAGQIGLFSGRQTCSFTPAPIWRFCGFFDFSHSTMESS